MGWAALLAAILIACALTPWVQWVRALAALRLPSRIERRPGPSRLQATVQACLQPYEAELSSLGFVHSHATQFHSTPRELAPWQPVQVWRHRQVPVIAELMAPVSAATPELVQLTMYAEVEEGLMVASLKLPLWTVPPSPRWCKPAGDLFASVKAQYEAQLALMQDEGLPDFLPWEGPETIEARLSRYEQRQLEALIEAGWLVSEGETLAIAIRRLPLLAAQGMRRSVRLRSALKRQAGASTPSARAARLEQCLALFVAGRAGAAVAQVPLALQWGLYLASWLPILLPCALLAGPRFALLLMLGVAVQEAGRWACLQRLGFRHIEVLPLPLIGGVRLPEHTRSTTRQQALLALAGTLPGLLAGVLVWALAPPAGSLELAGATLLLLNAACLLPFQPLDGAALVEALWPARRLQLRAVFEVLAVLAGLGAWGAAGWSLAGLPLAALWGLRALGWRPLWRQLRFEQQHRAVSAGLERRDGLALARQGFQLLERLLPARASMSQRLRMMDTLVSHLRRKSMPRRQVAAFAVLYGLLLLGALALAPGGWRSMSRAFADDPASAAADAAARAEARLQDMDSAALARALDPRLEASGAAELALSSLAQRTGRPLPAEVRAFYLARDGLDSGPELVLLPASEVQPLRDNKPRLPGRLVAGLRERSPGAPLRIVGECRRADEKPCEYRVEAVVSWLQVGEVHGRPVLLHPRPEGEDWRLVSLDTEVGFLAEEQGLRELLQRRWRERRSVPASASD
ncbi:hypothetical protein OOT46_14400 [Aquabacterium sp. A7-Y]|uniref:hypothetical protein n=1 Tax=Aquabacterium sp. A7-Y TaxID=1349605 RepID=UPI00223E392D|nr:hypothetical protein [Aquabacterium sp. A7-Y]MCW7539031.1 hypothetical protein [Aquabacterium sp. A7-Y]